MAKKSKWTVRDNPFGSGFIIEGPNGEKSIVESGQKHMTNHIRSILYQMVEEGRVYCEHGNYHACTQCANNELMDNNIRNF